MLRTHNTHSFSIIKNVVAVTFAVATFYFAFALYLSSEYNPEAEAVSVSRAEVSYFPVPHVILHGYQSGDLFIDKALLYWSPTTTAYVLINNANIEYNHNANEAIKMSGEVFIKNSTLTVNGNRFNIANGSIKSTRDAAEINAKLSGKNAFEVNAKLSNKDFALKFIESSSKSLSLSLTKQPDATPNTWLGRVQFNLDDLGSFVSIFLPDDRLAMMHFSDGAANVKYSDDVIEITDISANGQAIKTLEGNIKATSNNITADFHIKHIDLDMLDDLNKNYDMSEPDDWARFASDFITSISQQQTYNNNVDIQIDAQDIKLFQERYKTGKLHLENNEENQINLKTFRLSSGADAQINMQGTIQSNDIRAEFLGSIEYVSRNTKNLIEKYLMQEPSNASDSNQRDGIFAIKSDVKLTPDRIRLNNMRIALNDLRLQGRIYTFIQNDNINYSMSLMAGDINLSNYHNSLDNLLYHLYISDYDKSGNYFSQYFNDFTWLRRIKNELNLHLEINSLNLSDSVAFRNIQLDSEIKPNSLLIRKFSANEISNGIIDGNGLFSINLIRPYVNLAISTTKGNMLDMLQYFNNRAGYFNNAVKEAQQQKLETLQFLDDIPNLPQINFLGLHNFDADFKGNLVAMPNTQTTGTSPLKSASITCASKDGVIIIPQIEIEFTDQSKLSASGALNLTLPSTIAQANIEAENFNAGRLVKLLYPSAQLDGFVNFNSSFQSKGLDKSSFYNNMQGKMQFLAKDIIVGGFDIIKLVEAIERKDYQTDLRNQMLDYYTINGSSLFSDAEGNIQVTQGTAIINPIKLSNNRVAGSATSVVRLEDKSSRTSMLISFIPTAQNTPLEFSIGYEFNNDNISVAPQLNALRKYISDTATNSSSNQRRSIRQQIQ